MKKDRTVGQCSGSGLSVCWASDLGCVRENNEDSWIAGPEDGLLAVSDGMGGEEAGEVASQWVVEWLPGLIEEHVGRLKDPSPQEVEHALRDAVRALNHRVRAEKSDLDGISKMGATVTVALVRGSLAHIAHMGDSRAYLLHAGSLQRLTRDHSIVGMLLERGFITPQEARTHSMRGQLSRYVGMGGDGEPDLTAIELREHDRLLLCTDGLTDHLTDDEIREFLACHEDIGLACHALVDAANAAGGRDNTTVLIAEWQGE